ncbi:PIN domain-containing protein [Natrialbaceae archaeon A-chndr2]
MKILIDTNIFIHREDDDIVPEPLRELEQSLRKKGHTILIHPLSADELRKDNNAERRERNESRIETYPELSYPPTPSGSDSEFRQYVQKATGNDRVDNMLLYAVFADAVEFLITEDRGIQKKAIDLGIEDRVFTIAEGRDHFQSERPPIRGPVAIQRTTFGELDLSDPIFDSLKKEYDEFVEWAKSKSDRPAWVNYTDRGKLGAVLILKPKEVEDIGVDPPLGREKRLKISTLKVGEVQWGSKIGELLISIAIREAIGYEVDQVYLTHYVDHDQDYLVRLIERYGFEHASNREDGEGIFLKRLTPPPDTVIDPPEIARRYYPSFYDGEKVEKFLIPIQPQYHNKLFTGYSKRQPGLEEFRGEFNSEGNAIHKAYLSHSRITKLSPGDILLFYRSKDHKEITSLGICEEVLSRTTDPDEIQRFVGKRSVFSEQEIEEMAEKPTTVIRFSWHFDLENPLSLETLMEDDVLSWAPQAIHSIGEEEYKYIKTVGGIDERFALY